MPRICRECGQNTGPKRRLCKPCTLEARETREATTPLQTDAGQNVGAWIRTGETWHASVAFDGYEHEFACLDTFTDFPAADASIDHHALAHEHVCPDCRAAIDAESMPKPWKRAVADGGTVEPATEQQTLTPTDDTPEPRPNSALEREWNDLRKHADVNHESRPWEITHTDHDTDADRAYELLVSWTTNFLMAADAAYEWDRFTAVWAATEGDDEREIRTDGGQSLSVTEQGKYGDTRILVGELENSYQPINDAGDVKAKLWESDAGERRLYFRVRDHNDGRRFNEFSVDLDKSEGDVWCAECEERTVDPSLSDLSPAVCQSCRNEIAGVRPVESDTDRSEGSQ